MDPKYLTSREFLCESKEKILRLLYATINNGHEPDQSKKIAPFHQYRFYVGRGNNYLLVRSVVKQRWWWSIHTKEDLIFQNNFLWT